MKRRDVLGQLGVGGLIGLGGCVSPPSARSPSPSPPSTPTPPDDLQRRVSLNNQDSTPDESQVDIKVRLLESEITDAQTARLAVAVTNEGPVRRISVRTGGCAIFNRAGQLSKPRGLWLGHVERLTHVAQAGPEWIADPPGGFGDYGCSLRTYDEGEIVETEYGVFHDSRTWGYLDAGTYHFSEDVLVRPGSSTSGGEDESVRFNWGFSLTVENPNCILCL